VPVSSSAIFIRFSPIHFALSNRGKTRSVSKQRPVKHIHPKDNFFFARLRRKARNKGGSLEYEHGG
jgi:hypothetical protein